MTPGLTSEAGQHVWVRYGTWWHACFGVLAAGVLVLLALDDADTDAGRRWLAAGLVLALAAWYVAVGARQVNGRGRRRRDALAAVGTIALVLAGFAAHPVVAVLLFIVYPQLFAYLESLRDSVLAAASLSLGVAAIDAARSGWTARATLTSFGISSVSLAFAVLLGVWISRIIDQSRDRATLIEALESTRIELAAAHREAGAGAERQRLSLEIHDTLAQGFASVVMLVQAAEAEVGRHDDQVRHYLTLAERTARENLDEARSLVAELRPTPLQAASLAEALSRLTNRFADETAVTARFAVTGEPRPLDGSSEVVLLRVVQEALTNVRRHAAATAVDVALRYGSAGVEVRVSDDGRGFEPATAYGFGLQGMRERVGQAGGEVTVRSAPGRGSSVEVALR